MNVSILMPELPRCLPIETYCVDGMGHNDICCQLVSNPNSSKEETVLEGIDASSWNTELTTVPSHILSVWSQIQRCQLHRNLAMYLTLHCLPPHI